MNERRDDRRDDGCAGELERRATRLIHDPYRPPPGFASPVEPVHKASTVFFENTKALHSSRWIDKSAYTYGLHGTPTTFTLEARIAALEGGTHCLVVPSGLAAITLVAMALLHRGDEMLLPDNVYAPSKRFAAHELQHWGIGHALYDPMDEASLSAALTARTKLVWLEAPGSVTLEFPPLDRLVRLLRERAPQAVIALDNTWGAGLAFDAFALRGDAAGRSDCDEDGDRGGDERGDDAPEAVDISAHALTKYPSGGGDVLMGALTTRDEKLHQRLALAHSRIGFGIGGNDAELVLRALPSLPLRYAAQDAAGRRFAQWCTQRREFVRVLHPALPDSPGHANWARLCRAAAGLVTVEFDARHSAAQVDAFIDALRLFRIGWSWGGPISLAVPYQPAELRSRPTAYRGTLVRFAIGLEAVDDLCADVARALQVLNLPA